MRHRILLTTLTAVLMLTHPGRAQEDRDADDPNRGVARLSVMHGDVSVRRGDTGDWIAGALNSPLLADDRILTGADSRAEVQLDYSHMVRLAPSSELRFSELADHRYLMQLARGTVSYRVLRDSNSESEVGTPSVSVRPRKRGAYRISVKEDGQVEVTVRSGEVDVFTPHGTERVTSGKTMFVRVAPSDATGAREFQVARAIPVDEFDRWNERRDRDLERTASYRYVPRDVYGADELDDHGRWVNVPPYGMVWSPYVRAGWAPYRSGRWVWIDWYGWSWVSYDSWGWAPYHYGRWFHQAGYGWCWYPGGFGGRHYWRPALVGFFGWGGFGGFHAGFGFGNIGWVPLAPYERYYPWYGRRYYGGYRNTGNIDRGVHITNNVNITNIYRNARVTNGVTGVDVDGFTRGRAGTGVRDTGELRQAGHVRGQVPVAPGNESLRITDRSPGVVPRSGDGGRFFSSRQAAPVERVPFEQQRQGIERIGRSGGERASAPAAGLPSPAADAGGRVSRAEGTGWRRFGEPAPAASPVERGGGNNGWRRQNDPAPVTRTESRQDNWRRFGEPGSNGGSRTDVDRGRVQREPAWRNEAPRMERRTPDGTPRLENRQRSENLRINPPIVRERAPERSAPPQRAQERQAPAPRGDSGGGGRVDRGGGAPRGDSGGGGRVDRGGGAPRGDSGGGGRVDRGGGGGSPRSENSGGNRGGESRGADSRGGGGRIR